MARRRSACCLIGITLLALGVGCAAEPARTSPGFAPPDATRSAASKRITAAIQGDPATLSAAINSAGAGRARGVSELEEVIHAGLTFVDDRGVRRPQVAEEVPSVESGSWKLLPDGRMETTWRIRPGAQWHDGTPFTTDDLLFTALVGKDRDLVFISHVALSLVDAVEAIDSRTVKVTWSAPFIEADALFSYQVALPMPKHLLDRPYREDKSTFIELPYWTTDFVGMGAYRVREFVRASHVVLGSNEQYPLGNPKIGTIEVRFIPDLNIFVANLLAGEVEVALGRSLSMEQVTELRGRWIDGVLSVQPTTSWTALFPQHTSPSPAVLGEPQFRRALLHAIDRQQLVDVLLHGLVPVAHGMVSPAQAEFADVQPYVVRYDYDARRAVQLIEGFGFTRGAADGMFRDAANQPVTVEVRTTGGDDFRDKMLFSVADYWKQVGLNGDPVIIPRQRANDREYRVTRPAFEMVNQPTDLRGLMRFHSREMPTAENSYRGDNRARYASGELDGLLDRFTVTIPRAERVRILGDIVRHMTDRLVTMDVHYQGDVGAAHKRVKNVLPGGVWNAFEWDVSQGS